MAELRLPELGEDVEAVDVSAVLVAVGDIVRADQPLLEVETEKASLEVPSPGAGRITEIRVKVGDKLRVGDVILLIEPGGAGATEDLEPAREAPAPQRASAAPAAPAKEVATDAGTAPPADAIEHDAPPSEAARPAAVVAFPGARRGDRLDIGVPVPAAPSVRALARELGVDVRTVPGSGPAGRISRDDVKAHAKRLIRGIPPVAAGTAAASAPLPPFERWGEVERQALSNVRRATAENLARAWAIVPHVTQFDRADVTQLEAMRKRFNERPEAAGHKLTVTAMAVKITGAALRRFPLFNASLDLAAGQVVRKGYVHIGVAVDTERGLLVPVLRNVDGKRLLDVAAEIDDLARRAREKKITPEELRGASFTISNLGGLGTTYFSPIVPWPQVAILGIGRAEVQAVHDGTAFEPRRILPLSLSYDHRLIDGADAARFLRWIAEALEQPLLLLLDAPTE